ncbi:hypothetical protein B0H67DRAFT_27584 [Lasiosphaeris hirsuta]|uniref:Uncharacterized protein n=1 Tax=Lasiosphaeris hirsuta TaxID=260670 RepID=A0AA40E7Y6_9PEZI|nr:hypothetical protein B0H67DRAFT_27584 [Lasiosphaeris hirsuta]
MEQAKPPSYEKPKHLVREKPKPSGDQERAGRDHKPKRPVFEKWRLPVYEKRRPAVYEKLKPLVGYYESLKPAGPDPKAKSKRPAVQPRKTVVVAKDQRRFAGHV